MQDLISEGEVIAQKAMHALVHDLCCMDLCQFRESAFQNLIILKHKSLMLPIIYKIMSDEPSLYIDFFHANFGQHFPYRESKCFSEGSAKFSPDKQSISPIPDADQSVIGVSGTDSVESSELPPVEMTERAIIETAAPCISKTENEIGKASDYEVRPVSAIILLFYEMLDNSQTIYKYFLSRTPRRPEQMYKYFSRESPFLNIKPQSLVCRAIKLLLESRKKPEIIIRKRNLQES